MSRSIQNTLVLLGRSVQHTLILLSRSVQPCTKSCLPCGGCPRGVQEGFRSAKYFSIDRVFRNEAVDRTHLAESMGWKARPLPCCLALPPPPAAPLCPLPCCLALPPPCCRALPPPLLPRTAPSPAASLPPPLLPHCPLPCCLALSPPCFTNRKANPSSPLHLAPFQQVQRQACMLSLDLFCLVELASWPWPCAGGGVVNGVAGVCVRPRGDAGGPHWDREGVLSRLGEGNLLSSRAYPSTCFERILSSL